MTFARQATRILASIALSGLMVAANAAPVTFAVTPTSFTPGSGYGGSLLDLTRLAVSFSATNTQQLFSLSDAGDSKTFDFGTISLNQPLMVWPAETDNLGVSANFTFSNPLTGVTSVTASGKAFVGLVADAAADLIIDWTPVTVNFGDGGSFLLSMDKLVFTNSGALTQHATIKLLSSPNAVPEPGTLALAAMAVLALAGASRRRA